MIILQTIFFYSIFLLSKRFARVREEDSLSIQGSLSSFSLVSAGGKPGGCELCVRLFTRDWGLDMLFSSPTSISGFPDRN